MKQSRRKSSFLLFLVGLGSYTQVYFYGCIAISEICAFIVAPILFVTNYFALRQLRFISFLNMTLIMMGSMLISSWYNETAFPFVLKTAAAIYSIWAYFILFFVLLKDNLKGLRWIFVGVFLSLIITVFILNPTAQVSASGSIYGGSAEIEDVISGQLFWIGRFKALAQIAVCGFYLEFPLVLSLMQPIIFIGVAISTTVSGRSAAIAFIVSGAMMLVGRKNRLSMQSIGKHFFLCLFGGIILLFAVKQAYVLAAKKGFLSEEAQNKYESQTKHGSGILALLMSGRTGFFSAIPAALNRPIIGYGPGATDDDGYAERYVLKYGSEEDIAVFRMLEAKALLMGHKRLIPTHSYIMGAWVHCGIGGLIFYLWVLFLIYRHIKRYAAAIPQWYGYFAMMLPYYLWNIFFSPFGYRWQFALLMACLFFARAVGEGVMPLPYDMLQEVKKHEK